MKDGKTISERLRGIDTSSCSGTNLAALLGCEADCSKLCSECTAELLAKVSDEIEAEVEAARDTPKWYEDIRCFACEELGRPIDDGESMKAWLERNFIAIPTDAYGRTWAVGDACRIEEEGYEGEVYGYLTANDSSAFVRVSGSATIMAYPASSLSRIEPDTQERIDADALKGTASYWGCIGASCGSCPAVIDGKNPSQRYGVDCCAHAQMLDLLRRSRELDKAGE